LVANAFQLIGALISLLDYFLSCIYYHIAFHIG
jgi:hypothetical protein